MIIKRIYNDIKFQNVDYIFLISWKHLISESIIEKINIGIINLHYSHCQNIEEYILLIIQLFMRNKLLITVIG